MKLPIVSVLVLSACSSVTMMDGSDGPVSETACDVRVFQTQAQAMKQGAIEELCIITGDTSLRFPHHSSEAIAKHKDKACGCGASNVYVQSRLDGDIGMQGQVTMVAFRYVGAPASASGAAQPVVRQDPLPAARAAGAAPAPDAETDAVVRVLADSGFPLVGQPVRFKQKGNVTLYEARGAGGRLTQVACEAGACRVRTIHD